MAARIIVILIAIWSVVSTNKNLFTDFLDWIFFRGIFTMRRCDCDICISYTMIFAPDRNNKKWLLNQKETNQPKPYRTKSSSFIHDCKLYQRNLEFDKHRSYQSLWFVSFVSITILQNKFKHLQKQIQFNCVCRILFPSTGFTGIGSV